MGKGASAVPSSQEVRLHLFLVMKVPWRCRVLNRPVLNWNLPWEGGIAGMLRLPDTSAAICFVGTSNLASEIFAQSLCVCAGRWSSQVGRWSCVPCDQCPLWAMHTLICWPGENWAAVDFVVRIEINFSDLCLQMEDVVSQIWAEWC